MGARRVLPGRRAEDRRPLGRIELVRLLPALAVFGLVAGVYLSGAWSSLNAG